jgi:translation initiation factor 4E
VDFDTVEDFWGVYNNIAKATELVSGSNYHLFKLGVRPMWEDKMNEKGGKWVLQFPRNAKKPEDVNEAWLYTMLACIGAAYEQDEEICGCVMSVRKGFYRIALWIRNGAVDEVVQSCGKQFKASIGFAGNYEWSVHSDAIKPDAGGARRRH